MTTRSEPYWPPLARFPDDDPEGVRIVSTPREERRRDDGARLGRPWEREARDDLERALAAARAMRDDTEAFVGWIGRYRLDLAADYDHLIEEADARIDRLERMAELS
jgi:hypothetical protein